MFPFLSQKEKENYSLIIDIQSGLVRGSLIASKDNKNPRILSVITNQISRKEHVDSSYLIKMMLKSLSEILTKLANDKYIEKIDIVLSSPWVTSHSKTINIKYKDEVEVNDKLITDSIIDESKNFESQFDKDDLVHIEQKIFEVKLNGYPVSVFRGKKTKDLSISFTTTMSSKYVLSKISETIKKTLHIKKINFHSSLLLTFIALRNLVNDMNDYIFTHIHNELTDIIIIKRGLCSHISSFPIGISNLIRMISKTFKQTYEVADSTLSLHQDGKLSVNEEQKIAKLIMQFNEGWYSSFKKSVLTSVEMDSIPRSICISAHSHVSIFKDSLKILNNESNYIFDFNLDKIDSKIIFDKASDKNQLMAMYTLALHNVI